MSDFLQQLRSGSGKRYDRGRRPYDGNQYRNNDRSNNRDRKTSGHRKNFDNNQLYAIKKTLENIVEGQKTLTDLAERQAASSERIAGALEKIVSHLTDSGTNVPVVSNEPAANRELERDIPAESETAEPRAEGGVQSAASDAGRETVQELIREMRNGGATFDQIAEHLKAKEIPTLTGRGHWRAQVVSRLYNQVNGG